MKPEFPKWEADLLFVLAPLLVWFVLCLLLKDIVIATVITGIVFGVIGVRAVLKRLDKIIRLLSEKEEAEEDSSDGE